jgi:monoamine oxidase
MPGTGDPITRALRDRAAALRGGRSRPGAVSRRSLLAGGAALGAAAVLPADTALALSPGAWRAQRRQQERHGARVVIVGAGLAGLTCAYRLRQRGVHAQVFEARAGRVGGRCWTARGFEFGQVAEHGGEFIDTRHRHLLAIVEELGLSLEDGNEVELPGDAVSPLWLNGRLHDEGDVYAGFGAVVRRLEQEYERIGDYHHDKASAAARAFDEMTALEWLYRNVEDPRLREVIDLGQSGFWGADTSTMSAINLLESYVKPYPGADERYHVHGGNDRVPRGMARTLDRDTIRFDAPLRALWRRRDGSYGMRFGGVRGPVVADRVVLCLPFTALREVELAGSGLSSKRRLSIDQLGMGTNAKNHVQLDVRPYALGKWSGSMSMDAPFRQSSWDSTGTQSGPAGLITIWRGGRSGASYPTDVPHQWAPRRIVEANLAAFERGVPGVADAFNGRSWLDSWADDPWVRGSYAAFLPGQYTRYWGYLGKAEHGVHFAGEHTSTHSQGYLNGGVESGGRAAREVLAAIRRRSR